MPIYALGSLLLLNITTTDNSKYATYADDISCVAKLRNILTWWNKLNTFGTKMGYFTKANKPWLIIKPEKHETAKGIFKLYVSIMSRTSLRVNPHSTVA